MKKAKKPKQGGAREGAGRKSKFGDQETVRIGFRVPASQADIIKNVVNNYLQALTQIQEPGQEPIGQDPATQQAKSFENLFREFYTKGMKAQEEIDKILKPTKIKK